MSIFSSISDTLFGDQGEGAAEAQGEQNLADRQFIAQQTSKAREQAIPLFVGAQKSQRLGSQQALDALRGGFRSQLGAFQQGNVGAQETIEAAGATKELTDLDKSLADLISQFDSGAERGFNDDRGFFTNLTRKITELERRRSLLGVDTAAPLRQFQQVNGHTVRV